MTGAFSLTIRASGRVVATLEQSAGETARLQYDPVWLETAGAYPVSLTLPLRAEPFESVAVLNWVEGFLPYGALRDCVEATTGVTEPIALLSRLGADAPGALRFADASAQAAGLRPVADLGQFLERWSRTPLCLGTEGVSHTLTEASSDRLPICLIDRPEGAQIAMALHGAPSTHVLWREPRTDLGALENRVFHLALAAAVGLPVSGFRIMAADGQRMMITERDDRSRRGEGWIRLHRETLAQALGARVSERYGREPGAFADLETIFLWADSALEARERLRLLDAFLFNVLIGAPDAHLLRYAIRLQPSPALAPLMEIAGPGLAPPKERRFAQRIGGAARWPERITAEQWRDFATAAKLNPTFTLDRLVALAEAIEASAAPVADKLESAPHLQRAILGRVAREAKERARGAILRLRR